MTVWLLGIGVSTALLVLLYSSVDIHMVGATLWQSHPAWLVVSVGFIAPLTALRALRFIWIVPPHVRPGFGEGLRMTLVAGTFNLFLPAKTGDLVKSVVIARHRDATASLAVAAVVWERLADLFTLLLWGTAGVLFTGSRLPVSALWWLPAAAACAAAGTLIASNGPMAALTRALSHIRIGGQTPRFIEAAIAQTGGWAQLHAALQGRRMRLVLLSGAISFLQLSQIWLFAVAVHVFVPFTASIFLAAAILLVAQLPVTFGGLGARDLAIVVLFADYASPEAAAAIGILSATRSFLPALAGLAVMKPHLAAVVDTVRDWRAR